MNIDLNQMLLVLTGGALTLAGTYLGQILNLQNENRKERARILEERLKPAEKALDDLILDSIKIQDHLIEFRNGTLSQEQYAEFVTIFVDKQVGTDRFFAGFYVIGEEEIISLIPELGDELRRFCKLICRAITENSRELDVELIESRKKADSIYFRLLRKADRFRLSGYNDKWVRSRPKKNEVPR